MTVHVYYAFYYGIIPLLLSIILNKFFHFFLNQPQVIPGHSRKHMVFYMQIQSTKNIIHESLRLDIAINVVLSECEITPVHIIDMHPISAQVVSHQNNPQPPHECLLYEIKHPWVGIEGDEPLGHYYMHS